MKKISVIIPCIMAMGIILIVIGVLNIIKYSDIAGDFNDFRIDEMKSGEIFEGDINMVLDIIASSKDEKSSYYLIVVSNAEYEGYCIFETAYHQAETEKLCNQSWDYLTGETDSTGDPVHVKVRMSEAESNVMEWAEEWFENDGNTEAKQYLCKYKMVECTDDNLKAIIIISCGAVLLAAGIISAIIQKKHTAQ